MESDGARKDSRASRSFKKEIFKAVYINRFGEHCSGVVFNYDLKRGARKCVISGIRQAAHGSNEKREKVVRKRGTEKDLIIRARNDGADWLPSDTGTVANKEGIVRGSSMSKACVDSHDPVPHKSDIRGDIKERQDRKEKTQRRLTLKKKGGQIAASPEIPVLKQQRPRSLTDKGPVSGKGRCCVNVNDRYESNLPKQGGNKVKNCKIKAESQSVVLKVIEKMLDENEQLRKRLLQYSQTCSPADNGKNEIQSNTDKAHKNDLVFGWI